MEGKMQKSYFEVLGVCCPSEIPLIERILKPLDGVHKVSVSVPTKTVIVVHNNLLVSQAQIVRALNQARLDASVRNYGGRSSGKKKNWPSLYTVGSGVLLILSFCKSLYRPLLWLALAAVVVGLPPVLLRSYAAIRRLVLDINILLLIAVGGAIGLGDYQEAGTIVFLFTFAEWLECRASDKARDMMSSLMKEMPQKATVAETGAVVHPDQVMLNTVLVVKAGEAIPIDGVVVNGKSEVDEKSLTGESFPVEKSVGSLVWAGTMNLTGYIDVKTTALAEDSAVAKMAKLVEEAHQNRSRTQRIIQEFAKYYSPFVVIVSVGVAVMPAIMRAHNLHHWLYLSLVVLVSACPCALVLSTPVATECALRQAASICLLIKGGDHLESLARVKVVAFDKTGTLTRGKFSISHFCSTPTNVATREKLLYWVSSMESKSNHPMASALVDYSRLSDVEASSDKVKDFQVIPGEGIFGEIEGNTICIGNRRMARRLGCRVTIEGEDEKKRGIIMGYVVVNGILAGTFGVYDECRPGARQLIQELKSMGIMTAMLTGDSKVAAMHVQEQLGNFIDFVHADLLPEGKVSTIEDLKKLGLTAMVGDGMNDAPALATASVGIAMGVSGSAIAAETSHVTLMSDDIEKIATAIKLGRKTNRKILQNIVLSVATKAAILGLAFAGCPRLWAAVLADVGTCVLVILNSMLLLQGHSHVGECPPEGHGSHTSKDCVPCGGHGQHAHKSVWSRICGSYTKAIGSHIHRTCSPSQGHDLEEGRCIREPACTLTARAGLRSEDHGHLGCCSTNRLAHVRRSPHEDLHAGVIHGCHSPLHAVTCEYSYKDKCAKAGNHVATLEGAHIHTCEKACEEKCKVSSNHLATCRHTGKEKSTPETKDGAASKYKRIDTSKCMGKSKLEEEGEVRVQIDGGGLVEEDSEQRRWQRTQANACKPPSTSRASELFFTKNEACELHGGGGRSSVQSSGTCHADQDMRGSRCCRSVCVAIEGVYIHERPFLAEIVTE